MGQHAHKLGRSDPHQWRHQNKAPLQCTDTYEGKIKAAQPHQRPRLHNPSYGSSRMHMVHSQHHPTSLSSHAGAFFPRIHEPSAPK